MSEPQQLPAEANEVPAPPAALEPPPAPPAPATVDPAAAAAPAEAPQGVSTEIVEAAPPVAIGTVEATVVETTAIAVAEGAAGAGEQEDVGEMDDGAKGGTGKKHAWTPEEDAAFAMTQDAIGDTRFG